MATLRVPIQQTWDGNGSPGVNVWHLRAASGGEEGTASSLIPALHDFYTSISALFAPGWKANLGPVTVEETREEVATPAWTEITTTGIEKAPPALAVVLGLRTSSRSRRGTGRIFLGPLSWSSMETDGSPTLVRLNAINTAAATLLSASQAIGNGGIAVYGYENAVPPGGTRQPGDSRIARDVTEFVVQDKFAVLRSRRD